MAFFLAAGHCREIDRIVAVIDSRVITESELIRTILPVANQYRSLYSGEKLEEKIRELQKTTLEQMVQNNLLLLEAEDKKIEVADIEIDKRVREISAKIPDKSRFREAIVREYGSEAEFRKALKEQILIKKIMYQQVGPNLVVSVDEIKDYYNSHPDEFNEGEKVRLRHFLLKKVDGISWEELEKKALDFRAQLDSGADFEEMIKKYSDGPNAAEGGDMGFVGRGKVLAELEAQAFVMPAGAISQPIRTHLGFHIVRVEALKKPRTVGLEEVSAKIEESIVREKRREALRKYTDGLQKKYHVEIRL